MIDIEVYFHRYYVYLSHPHKMKINRVHILQLFGFYHPALKPLFRTIHISLGLVEQEERKGNAQFKVKNKLFMVGCTKLSDTGSGRE